MSNDRRLLVTGGSGFIGSELARLAGEAGFEIVNLDIKPPVAASQKPMWRQLDVRDADAVRGAILEAQPSHIAHLASDIDVNIKHLHEFKTTIDGTRNVLAAAEALPGLKRFLHTSTQYVVRPGVVPKSETDYVPYTVYGEAKTETERLVRASKVGDWIIARPTVIWGPGHPSFAQQIWRRMAEGRYRHPATAKPLMRGYGYVTNTAWQMLKLLEAPRPSLSHTVYYLGDGMIEYGAWADAFCVPLTGRPAKRLRTEGLWALGAIGSAMRAAGLPAPYDMGRYFRMTTPGPTDFGPINEVANPQRVSFDEGVARTLVWLRQVDPVLFAGDKAARQAA